MLCARLVSSFLPILNSAYHAISIMGSEIISRNILFGRDKSIIFLIVVYLQRYIIVPFVNWYPLVTAHSNTFHQQYFLNRPLLSHNLIITIISALTRIKEQKCLKLRIYSYCGQVWRRFRLKFQKSLSIASSKFWVRFQVWD